MSRRWALAGNRFTFVAITFELSLGLVGCLLSWAVGDWPRVAVEAIEVRAAWRDTGIGLAAALPFLAGLVLIDRHPTEFLQP